MTPTVIWINVVFHRSFFAIQINWCFGVDDSGNDARGEKIAICFLKKTYTIEKLEKKNVWNLTIDNFLCFLLLEYTFCEKNDRWAISFHKIVFVYILCVIYFLPFLRKPQNPLIIITFRLFWVVLPICRISKYRQENTLKTDGERESEKKMRPVFVFASIFWKLENQIYTGECYENVKIIAMIIWSGNWVKGIFFFFFENSNVRHLMHIWNKQTNKKMHSFIYFALIIDRSIGECWSSNLILFHFDSIDELNDVYVINSSWEMVAAWSFNETNQQQWQTAFCFMCRMYPTQLTSNIPFYPFILCWRHYHFYEIVTRWSCFAEEQRIDHVLFSFWFTRMLMRIQNPDWNWICAMRRCENCTLWFGWRDINIKKKK